MTLKIILIIIVLIEITSAILCLTVPQYGTWFERMAKTMAEKRLSKIADGSFLQWNSFTSIIIFVILLVILILI